MYFLFFPQKVRQKYTHYIGQNMVYQPPVFLGNVPNDWYNPLSPAPLWGQTYKNVEICWGHPVQSKPSPSLTAQGIWLVWSALVLVLCWPAHPSFWVARDVWNLRTVREWGMPSNPLENSLGKWRGTFPGSKGVPRLLSITRYTEDKMGNTPSIPTGSLLGYIRNQDKFDPENLKKKKKTSNFLL